MAGGPKYPNQQLLAVSLETFFRGRFSVTTSMAAVQDAFATRFRDLYVPNATPNKPLDLAPYHLRSQDGSEALMLALNQASYVSYDYPGHDAFMENCIGLLRDTHKLLGVTELERVAYNYQNQILLQRGADGTAPVEKMLKVDQLLGPTGNRVVQLHNEWQTAWDGGRVAVRASLDESDPLNVVLNLGIAALVMPAGPVADLETYAARAHDEGYRCFEAMITDEFRDYIKQSPGE